jgi:hypothetical protein
MIYLDLLNIAQCGTMRRPASGRRSQDGGDKAGASWPGGRPEANRRKLAALRRLPTEAGKAPG